MIQLLIFILSFYLVSVSSKQINKIFFSLNHSFSRRFNFFLYLYSIMLLPGTLLHELSHVFMATILYVRTGSINLFPKYQSGHGLTLGTAQIAKTDFIRLSLIGLAPTIFGLLLISLIASFIFDLSDPAVILSKLFSSTKQLPHFTWRQILGVYLVFTISNTMHTSKTDRQAWPLFIIILILFLIANYFIKFFDINSFLTSIPSFNLNKVTVSLGVALAINLALLIIFFVIQLLARVFQRPMIKFLS